jgi:hypothetical protein
MQFVDGLGVVNVANESLKVEQLRAIVKKMYIVFTVIAMFFDV